MKDLASALAKQRVAAAVTAIEKKTSAEIVVAVLPQSRDYWQGRVVLAVLGGLELLHAVSARARAPSIATGASFLGCFISCSPLRDGTHKLWPHRCRDISRISTIGSR